MRMPCRFLVVFLTLCVLVLSGPASADLAPEPPPIFVGTFRYAPDDGTAVPFAFRGEHYRLSQRLRGPLLVQTMATNDGAATNEWTLSPDGSTLSGKITITSPQLLVPIVFTLTYKRSS